MLNVFLFYHNLEAFQCAYTSANQLEFGLEKKKRHMGLLEVIKPGVEIYSLFIKTSFFSNKCTILRKMVTKQPD